MLQVVWKMGKVVHLWDKCAEEGSDGRRDRELEKVIGFKGPLIVRDISYFFSRPPLMISACQNELSV